MRSIQQHDMSREADVESVGEEIVRRRGGKKRCLEERKQNTL